MTALAPPADPVKASGPRLASGESRWKRRAPLLPALIFSIIITQLPFLATLLISPFLVMPVAAALLWKHAIYNPTYGLINGTLNGIAHLFGGTGPTIDWVSTFPMAAVVVALVWQWTPFMMLILLAGLQSQPG